MISNKRIQLEAIDRNALDPSRVVSISGGRVEVEPQWRRLQRFEESSYGHRARALDFRGPRSQTAALIKRIYEDNISNTPPNEIRPTPRTTLTIINWAATHVIT